MKFVTHHLTKHHLLHAPHRWFMAFLLSPIHALEVHYQHRYHLQFAHARKLFIFDMLLLASIVVIGGAAISWYWYDPTVTKQVALDISVNSQTEQTRVKSGEPVTFIISYQNNSPEVLVDGTLHFNLPAGFILQSAPPLFVTSTNSINLPNLNPRASGELHVSGRFWEEPGKNTPVQVELVYRQQKTDRFEVKTAGILATPADSVLVVSANFPTTIYSTGSWEIPVTLTNTSNEPVNDVFLPFPNTPGLTFSWKETGVTKKPLYFKTLTPNSTVTSTLRAVSNLPTDTKSLNISLTPQINLQKQLFNQKTVVSTITVLHPGLKISSQWNSNLVNPGETTSLVVRLENTGNTDLTNLNLLIPLPRTHVNLSQSTKANRGTLKGNTLSLSAREWPQLQTLTQNQTVEIPLSIVIASEPSGSADFALPLNITATVPNQAEKFAVTATTPVIKLGTFISLYTDAHYYSLEGDQIGRGPLPPKVGKETKYWALLALTNGPGPVSNATVSATLAPGVVWTGKSSVSRGREPIYNPATRTITWTASSIPANETISIDFELSVTPTEAQKGSIPLLLTTTRATAVDPETNKTLSTAAGSLNASLSTDTIAKQKGVRVE